MKSDKKYQFWLEAGGKRIQLPVNPETVKISRSGNNSSMTIIGLGEITNIQEPKSAVISFSGIFPKAYFPGCAVKKLLLPHYYITVITNWQKEKLPVRIYITACDIVWYTSIESFSYSQSGGDVGSYDYSLTLKQYQMIRVRRINITKNKTAQTQKKKSSRISSKSKPKTYTVKSGDSLYNIAKQIYGDGAKCTVIYEANKKTVGPDPNRITAGQILTIP